MGWDNTVPWYVQKQTAQHFIASHKYANLFPCYQETSNSSTLFKYRMILCFIANFYCNSAYILILDTEISTEMTSQVRTK